MSTLESNKLNIGATPTLITYNSRGVFDGTKSYTWLVACKDNNNNYVSGLYTPLYMDSSTSNSNRLQMLVYNSNNTNNEYAHITVGYRNGTPFTEAPTPPTTDNSTQIATTAYVKAQNYATLASPALTGTPTAPTASVSTNNTQIATTAFVKSAMSTWNAVTVTSVTTYCASGLGGYMSVYQNPYLKLCCVSLNIQLLATTIPGSTAIINGFPKALKNSGLNCIDSSSNGIRMFINTNGELCLDGSKTFSAATWVNGSVTYPYSSL